jgi:hypothetical protein
MSLLAIASSAESTIAQDERRCARARGVRQIARDAGDAGDLAVGVSTGEIVTETGTRQAAFRDALGFEMSDRIAAADPFDRGVFLLEPLGGDEYRHGSANRLDRTVAEHPFGPSVPGFDGAVERLCDDGVV